MEEKTLLTFDERNNDTYIVTCKRLGLIGEIKFIEKFNLYCFQSIENFFLKPVHLALILKKCNELNGYVKTDKKEVKTI